MRILKEKDPIPACQIRIDKEGVWYYQGAEMFRREFVNYFYQHLRRDTQGRYVIELPNDRCYIEAEDTPYFVKAVYPERDEGGRLLNLQVLLCDDTREDLDPETLYIGDDNVCYCRVRSGQFPARFFRAAYYQLAENIEYDDERSVFCLRMDGRVFDIGVKSG
ncbi:MAG TPA: DUF1285 domain-containing protein [Syntrophales bacterium]|jgi:hypothetical protein|nr:DUF1285 domain-containing protein [Syntrophales bacterium]HON23284.1 DUF1285 domain-containing protein [Syntrophales bacterium]HOU76644.1 DUF1285 domain-containing protein [Syntrophales bacterium]HPC31401.1 DUF1285 domain-containing protein [Syntrophales bacterium]HQG33307.1 DUF1285 domain-containing protein [Syntrophales bacterium]